jgi:Arc/MetJ-type ribon-helix-helix transcriptional regulator
MSTMTTTITLTPEQSERLKSYVVSGRFTSADQVVERFVSQVLDDELLRHTPLRSSPIFKRDSMK